MKRNFVYLFAVTCLLAFFSCQKEYSFEKGNTIPAEGSLWDSAGDCLPSTVHGTYYNGVTPGGDTAYVELQVNVTKTGGYNIKTDTANGFSFSDSGYFSSTGINTIQLKPSGHPIIVGISTFNVSFDSTFCSFTINVQDSTGTGLGGADTTATGNVGSWQFTTTEGTFNGTFYAATVIQDTFVWNSGGKMLAMAGFTKSTTDSAITLIAYLPESVIETGVYKTDSVPPANAAVFAFNYTTGNGDPIYEAFDGTPIDSDVSVTISSYDDATHVVTGTFSGTAENVTTGAAIQVTNGSFSATVSP